MRFRAMANKLQVISFRVVIATAIICINSFKEQVLISEGCTMLVKQFIPFIYLTFISIQAGGGYIVVMC